MNLSPYSPNLPARRPRNLAMRVVDSLADRIRDGSLACGDKLATESALMAEFGVSRTVIREALSKLQAAALVQTRHGVGTFVTHGGVDSAVFRIRARPARDAARRGRHARAADRRRDRGRRAGRAAPHAATTWPRCAGR